MVAAVTVGAVAFGQGVFDHESAGPTNPDPTGVHQLEPATPRGLAAAAIDQFGLGQPKIVAGERPSDGAQSDDQLIVGMGYELDDAKVEIQVYTSSDVTVWREIGCDQPDPAGVTTIGCSEKPLPDGTPSIHALIRAGSGSENQTVYQALTSVRRPDQVVLVTETVYVGANDSTEYTEATLPIPMDDLIAVVTSPSVGTLTTAAYNDAGEHIEGFKDSMDHVVGFGVLLGRGQRGHDVVQRRERVDRRELTLAEPVRG